MFISRSIVVEFLKGSYAGQEIIDKLCNSIHPRQLAIAIREGKISEIDQISQIGETWTRKIVERAQAHPEFVYSLEAVPTEDLVEIFFKVGKGEYKPIDKLSTGQKATVIVLLTMVEGKFPIVFDQPEDALYTPFIYSEVVKILRREKDQRQFILATHNANISVAADLDLGIILEGTSTQSRIEAVGGLDDPQTQALMVLHLEGGKDAFLTRQRKYGL